MQPLQICIGPIIRIGRESWCLPYAGFFFLHCIHCTKGLHLSYQTSLLNDFNVSLFNGGDHFDKQKHFEVGATQI